ncbi:hypothetical protein E5F05_19095 [Deinococcus metallilatus]|uniref:Uncharacterized protein n=1 Tax=Deinococcus metallilatus TaxID=1211322 RepID=A0AAJ5JZ31_9DEIO|nr:hypothetical protein [Deinococcus metallilatus]MBB5296085.1 hypothetical protein [Deinococcus metallilatus]QBY09858.1 hypothetical protein E5F05_19095 [Deinococcus metallilatus]RXJ08855.1 hypothetical protein ERJ73_17935 [Deinococcus metallilatus]TLK23335.1 hypothetical protein FCS05_16525 [Deinococcus metallilatus]
MFAWLPRGDRLAALSVLEERAARLAPEFLPVLRAARAAPLTEPELRRLEQRLAWRILRRWLNRSR